MTATTSKHWARKSFQQTTASGSVNKSGLQESIIETEQKPETKSSELAGAAGKKKGAQAGSRPLSFIMS